MDNFGFIHGELDTKILILYVLRRLPRPVDAQTLTELCSFDTGVGWFDYADCLAGLEDTGHVERLQGERYVITDKGAADGEAAETSLPYSVRVKASRLIEPVAEKMRRDAMIEASHEAAPGGGTSVRLRLSDGKGEVMSLRLLVPDEASALAAERCFRADAEGIYQRIAELLLEGTAEK